MKTFRQLVAASAKDILRDKMTLFWFLAFPVLIMLLFGAIFSNEGTASYDVGVVSSAGDPLSEGVLAGIRAVHVFNVSTGALEDELEALRNGKRDMVVDASGIAMQALASSGPAKIRVYYDNTQTTAQQVLLPVVQQVLDGVERRIDPRPRAFEVAAEPVQSTVMKMVDFLLPGVLAMAIMQLGVFGSMRAVSLREQKVLKSLGATPLPRKMLIAAEVLVRMAIALLQALIMVAVGRLVFHVVMVNGWHVLLGVVLLGAATFVSLGFFLASFPRTEDAAVGVAQVVQFPMMFLSGIFFPVEMMPSFLKPVMTAMPLTYLADLLRQVMVGAPPAHSLFTNLAVLGGWTVVSIALAVMLWRWE